MLADYNYFREAEELLRKLRHLISKTIAAWAKFDCLEGDVAYFLDLECRTSASNNLLCEIREIFKKVERHQQTLDNLSELCRDYINEVSYIRVSSIHSYDYIQNIIEVRPLTSKLQFRLTLEAATYSSSSPSTRTDFVTFV
jgi:hypothetical protein